MYSKTPLMNKRSREQSGLQRPSKIPFGVVKVDVNTCGEMKNWMFRILMPDGTTLELKMQELRNQIPIEEFIDVVRKEYFSVVKQGSSELKRKIDWTYQDLHFSDAGGNKIRIKLDLCHFTCKEWHFLWLHDGSPEPDAYEGMWDLTPDTDLLKELPDDYTFETALADLIDNSLQALWSNDKHDIKLISVEVHANKIIVFDSGPGMDGTNGNLVNWGKMGSSSHRSARGKAIGGSPPYLVPFFGMFGYGGPVATMCLGRRAVVSSKTKNCKKVFTLHLEREALISASRRKNCWRTKGGTRDPLKDENVNSRHGSFSKVEIFEPKMKIGDIEHFKCKLKDIYFPYIQCDEISGKTSRPVKFQVNGEDLAGIPGGEVATTNLHSCNGPNFIVQLHFSIIQDPSSMVGQSKQVFLEANARLKFVYFPIIEGKESIQRIIDCLDAEGYGIGESYETFSRVSIRRLGRLLPDARWASLPIMEPTQKRGEMAKTTKRCCSRVKCFIDTDAGFNPTTHKIDLAQNHPYTKALKNFGKKVLENEKEVQVEISKDGNKVTLSRLEKLFHEWISDMHQKYDEEIEGGLDQPTIVLCPPKNRKLGLSSEVLRVHKRIQRREMCWYSGQKIKVLKGACVGCHRNNVYSTLEYIIFEGLQGDACGEARLICRPLGLPEDSGCKILDVQGKKSLEIGESIVFPTRVIDSNKCMPVDETEWGKKFEKHCQKLPSTIELLSNRDCRDLEIEGGMPDDVINAGDVPPETIVAVIRPKAFNSENSSKRLDQKFIVKDNIEMCLEVKFKTDDKNAENLVISSVVSPSSQKGVNGFYVFPLKSKWSNLFKKAGYYIFSFSLIKFSYVWFEQILQVHASANAACWKVVSSKQGVPYTTRVGSSFDPLCIACFDKYGNSVEFTSVPKLTSKLSSNGTVIGQVRAMKGKLSIDKSRMIIEGIVESNKLDDIRSTYEATFNISTRDEAFSVGIPFRVLPGTPHRITVHPPKPIKQLSPGQIIEDFALEIFDEYGNHAMEEEKILLSVDGFSYEDRNGVFDDGASCVKKVDSTGFVHLSNILRVSKGYGQDVSLSVSSKDRVLWKKNFQTEMRLLQSVSEVFKNCEAGSILENVVFEIVNSEGIVDESVNHDEKLGRSHTLRIKSKALGIDDSVQYTFRRGRCTIRSIPLPDTEGVFSISAVHSCYPELAVDIEVHVENARHEYQGDTGSHGVTEHLASFPHDPCEDFLSPPQTCSLKALRSARKLFSPPCPKESVVPASSSTNTANKNAVPASSSATTANKNVVRSTSTANKNAVPTSQSPKTPKETPVPVSHTPMTPFCAPGFSLKEELEDDLIKCNKEFEHCQAKYKMLNRKLNDLQNASDMQDHDRWNGSSQCGKEFVLEKIACKSLSAAAVICELEFRSPDILGVVALIGTVECIELSRMLALYLGDDLMRAIVCKNYVAARSLETKCGKPSIGGYYTLCLEDISPFYFEPSNGLQDRLDLQMPTMPDGNVPPGFLGYAVNMINIEATLSQWRTAIGHGLRETLFYRVFGELQVYDERSQMIRARSCIKGGAISLDGGIMKGNGLFSFGQWEPNVVFPVLKPKGITRYISVAKIQVEMEKVRKSRNIADEKFIEARARYNSYRTRKI